MELPKNITQIGEVDKHCRIYVEDYVVSYIKQMNGMAQNKDIAIALYGRRTVEEGVEYLFAYGSAKLNFLQKTVRHLSQAQEQEIEKLRKKYFPEMIFLGYQILNGEMVEGFQVCEQEICRYVAGYAQFYEKNDSMLAYMLENKGEEAAPEQVDQEKYEAVKKHQEERRQRQEIGAPGKKTRESEKVIQMPTVGLRRMKMAATGVFVLLCIMALALMQQESTGEPLGETVRQAMSNLMVQQLPDAVSEQEQISTLVAEDKLENALRQENAAAESAAQATSDAVEEEPVPTESFQTETIETAPVITESTETTDVTETTEISETKEPEEAVSQPVAYTIRKGDTLIGISLRNYGTDTRVSEICSLNGISDPDDIKTGQEILLP